MPQLLDLPVEVLAAIASEFCAHCVSEREPCPVGLFQGAVMSDIAQKYRWQQHITLSALSETCQQWRGIAQPLLFHCAIPPGIRSETRDDVSVQSHGASLTCALVQRPDLARAVQVLQLPDEWYHGTYWELSKQQAQVLRKAWAEFHAENTATYPEISPELFCRQEGEMFYATKSDYYSPFGLQMESLMLWRAFNIKSLFTGSWLTSPTYFPKSLTRLTEFVNMGYWEPEGDPVDVELETLIPALRTMPQVQLLTLNYLQDWKSSVSLNSVIELNLFYSTLKAGDFINLFRSTPNLVHLNCTQTFHPHSLLGWLGEALQPCQNTLKTMVLETQYDEGDDYDETPDDHTAPVTIGPLDKMRVLEELKITLHAPRVGGRSRSPQLASGADLIDILPSSIRKLSLEWWYNSKSLFRLAEKAPVRFPNLNRVHLYIGSAVRADSWDMSKLEAASDALREVGITLETA